MLGCKVPFQGLQDKNLRFTPALCRLACLDMAQVNERVARVVLSLKRARRVQSTVNAQLEPQLWPTMDFCICNVTLKEVVLTSWAQTSVWLRVRRGTTVIAVA